jgi:hypothetical protein
MKWDNCYHMFYPENMSNVEPVCTVYIADKKDKGNTNVRQIS